MTTSRENLDGVVNSPKVSIFDIKTGRRIFERGEFPLSADELARWGSLPWINPTNAFTDHPDPAYGVKQLVIGRPDGFTTLSKNQSGELTKQDIIQENSVRSLLGGGADNSVHERISRILYSNDSRMLIGHADTNNYELQVYFDRMVTIDAIRVIDSIRIAQDLMNSVNQDLTAREIKAAERELIAKLKQFGQSGETNPLLQRLQQVLGEAGVSDDLISQSRDQLPVRIRAQADRMEELGIKIIEYPAPGGLSLWSKGLRETYTPETDNEDIKEWHRGYGR